MNNFLGIIFLHPYPKVSRPGKAVHYGGKTITVYNVTSLACQRERSCKIPDLLVIGLTGPCVPFPRVYSIYSSSILDMPALYF
jgi:hypothetical protein